MRNAIKIIFLTAVVFILTALCAYAGEFAEYTAPDGVRYRVDYDNGVIAYCIDKKITKVEIPQTINGQAVKRVDFSNCAELVEVEIPEGITEFSFSGCTALTTVKIPEGTSLIREKAFHNCKALANIELPATLTVIRDEAFSGCSALSSIEIPESVTSVDSEAFSGCTVLKISVPQTVKYIGGYDYKTAYFAPFYKVKSAEYEGRSSAAVKSAISPYMQKKDGAQHHRQMDEIHESFRV